MSERSLSLDDRVYDYLLAASIRHSQHLVQCAMLGADVATVPFKVIQQMMKHPLTDVGLKRFLEDWERMKASVGELSGVR